MCVYLCLCPAVFGRVVEGLEFVKQIETSRTNAQDKPVQPIVIANCGQILPENDAAAAKAKAAEKQAAVSDDEDEQHELPAAAPSAQPLYPVSKGTAQLDAASSAVAAAAAEEAKLKAALTALPADMNPRQRKLAELKLKMSGARRANAAGVAEETRKFTADKDKEGGGGEGGAKRAVTNAEFRARKANWESEQIAAGQDPALAYMHDTAENAQYRAQGKADKQNKKASFGWDVFNEDAQYNAYTKRLAHLPTAEAAGGAAAAAAGGDVDDNALNYARSSKPAKAGVERMVAELEDAAKRKEKFSRRRAFNEEEDVSYINERNRVFNKKAQRAFESYTLETRQNLERGTAL